MIQPDYNSGSYSHSVLPLLSSSVRSIHLVIQNDVEISGVLAVGSDRDSSGDTVVGLEGNHLSEVENGFCGCEVSCCLKRGGERWRRMRAMDAIQRVVVR